MLKDKWCINFEKRLRELEQQLKELEVAQAARRATIESLAKINYYINVLGD